MKEAASNPELEGMGTTLVAALESGPELLIASVGDSRVYVYDGSELKGITEDQTWVNEVGRRLGIDEASLRTHPMRHVLTMAIGVSPELRVHSYTVHPNPGELILHFKRRPAWRDGAGRDCRRVVGQRIAAGEMRTPD